MKYIHINICKQFWPTVWISVQTTTNSHAEICLFLWVYELLSNLIANMSFWNFYVMRTTTISQINKFSYLSNDTYLFLIIINQNHSTKIKIEFHIYISTKQFWIKLANWTDFNGCLKFFRRHTTFYTVF